ncbi:MAG: hypothetical protein ACFFC7_05950 [Candidatus Hermodarchaeota archaeon]
MAVGVKNRQKALERILEEYKTSSGAIKSKKIGLSKRLLNFYRSEERIRAIERASKIEDQIQAEFVDRRRIW